MHVGEGVIEVVVITRIAHDETAAMDGKYRREFISRVFIMDFGEEYSMTVRFCSKCELKTKTYRSDNFGRHAYVLVRLGALAGVTIFSFRERP